MKIIFTGAGSFTGYWIVKKLVEDGHKVYPLFEEKLELCTGPRAERIKKLSEIAECFFGINYGSKKFFDFLSKLNHVDIFCQHFFNTKDYKSPDYNIINALYSSIGDVKELFRHLRRLGCGNFILTGSAFEENEGAGDVLLAPFSPYGLAKTIASRIFSYYAEINGIKFSKFVIPNPFGPYEEYKFTSYLADTWFKGETPPIKFPDYVRDNIPVDLLAMAYSMLISRLAAGEHVKKLSPSGYVLSNAGFVKKMSNELSERLGIECAFRIEKQVDFQEPKIRYNTDKMFEIFPEYQEKKFWDELAFWYEISFRNKNENQRTAQRGV